jgi:hypothetical protein
MTALPKFVQFHEEGPLSAVLNQSGFALNLCRGGEPDNGPKTSAGAVARRFCNRQ